MDVDGVRVGEVAAGVANLERVAPAGANEDAGPTGADDVARTAGRGGLAVAFAKIYFILQGLVQQIALPRVLGLDGYGAWSTVNSIGSMVYNPVVTMSIQGVSRATTQASAEDQPAALRRTLRVHATFGVILAGTFYLLSSAIADWAGAPHVSGALAILSVALLLYAIYAPLIGALNGQKRFLFQAGFDVLAATLRTAGLVLGAYLLVGSGRAVEGAASGFVVALSGLCLLSLFVVGVGRQGPGGISVKQHLLFVLPVLLGQVLLNLLLQADLTLLRRFAAEAAQAQGLAITAADPLVGAYRATQLFSFLPYQLLISVNFILFPMLASAVREADRDAIARYVATGVRIALLVAGGMVSVTAGLSDRLLLLVFGARAADLGGRSLELLSLGFGAFAIFGVLTTVLNSLRKERSSALVTAGAAGVVALLCWLRVRGSEFGEGLLFRTASATSVGLLLATIGAGVLVYRAAGAIVAPLSAARVIAAIAIAVTLGRFLPQGSAAFTVASVAIVGICYLLLLLLSRELGPADLALFQRVLARGKPR